MMRFFSESRKKRHWRRLHKRSRAELTELAERDLWKDWEFNVSPEFMVEFEFNSALKVLAGSDDRELADRFLQRSIDIADRALSENKMESPGCVLRFPRNRASIVRTKTYAEALAERSALQSGALLCASRDYEQALRQSEGLGNLNEQTSFDGMESIQLSLLAGEFDRTRQLLRELRRPLKHHNDLGKILKVILSVASGELKDPRQRHKSIEKIDAYYDDIRDPTRTRRKGYYMPPGIGPFTVGLLRETYLSGSGEPVHWNRVIADYCR